MLYVAIIVIVTMLAQDVLDMQSVFAIQTTLDLPTAIALVAFSILSLKLELDKPKHRQLQKNHSNIDALLLGGGAVLVVALIYLKYFM